MDVVGRHYFAQIGINMLNYQGPCFCLLSIVDDSRDGAVVTILDEVDVPLLVLGVNVCVFKTSIFRFSYF